ncbi:MAG: tetratricopeptide repeat protein [Candidatus Hydrogenedentes bacterium]|nr:tetratricopeptide repeat protein [Candidatus Hydrogenedentota bacterium]
MNKKKMAVMIAVTACLLMLNFNAFGNLKRGMSAPNIQGVDISGKDVDLNEIIAQNPYLLVVYCFAPGTGDELAAKLQGLQMRYGREKFQVVALGIEQDEGALKDFAKRLGIRYHVMDASTIGDTGWLKTVSYYPLTLFVETTPSRRIDQVLAGDGLSPSSLLTEFAESLFRQRREEALEVVEEAIEEGDDSAAHELRGFILAGEGKLDEAEEEFGSLESPTGLAKVALERGDFEEAIKQADLAGDDPYAVSIKAEALARLGKMDAAAAAMNAVSIDGADKPWKAAEAANSRGRIKHHQGDIDGAILDYQIAREIDGYGVKPLSNEAAAQREQGNLEEAQELLVQAQQISDDNLIGMLLQQVRGELEDANNLKRQELIRSQIQSLSERYKELKAAGLDTPVDAWSTRPLTVALLPGKSSVFFERAGTDVALQRDMESRLQADPRVQVLERVMLDQLLQELELGSSELADPNTQQVLGRVLSARYLGFVDYAQVGAELTMYLRLVETETTALATQVSQPVDVDKIGEVAETVVARILEDTADGKQLKGLVADVTDEGVVMVNLGREHGVVLGQRFDVFTEGEPIEVGGRIIAHRQNTIGRIEITSVEDGYSLASIVKLRKGAKMEKELKIKASAPSADGQT